MVSWHEDVLHTFRLEPGARFGEHCHDAHQFVWALDGLLRAESGGQTWMLSSTSAVWIPPFVDHDVVAVGAATLRTFYLHVAVADPLRPARADAPVAVHLDALLLAVVDRLAGDGIDSDERAHLERVLIDCCRRQIASGRSASGLALPLDERARRVAAGLIDNPADDRTLAQWAAAVGASRRTLIRLFSVETGIGFEQWRRQTRLHIAHRLLLDGMAVERCARQVGYRNASAFGAAYRATYGHPPTRAVAAAGA